MTETMKQINKLINEAGYSHRRFAQECGVTETSLSRWLKGIRTPTIEVVEIMLNVLKRKFVISDDNIPIRKSKVIDVVDVKQQIRAGQLKAFIRNGNICLQDMQTTETVVIGNTSDTVEESPYYI